MTAAAVDAGTLARGRWCVTGEAPLLVSDPMKARWLLGVGLKPPSARARQRHEHGLLPVSYFRQAAKSLALPKMRALERLVCGGGNVLFRDEYHNLVVNQGLDDLLNITIGGNVSPGQDTTWFVGLTDGAPLNEVAGDTMGSHSGWVEVQNYDEATRVAWIANDAAQTGQSTSNSSSPADFTISATVTIGGSFLVGLNTKGGTTGRLYSVGAFTAGDKLLNDNDTLAVTSTFTTAAP